MISILESFGICDVESVTELKTGHINRTYLCECGSGKYILQSLNRRIFGNFSAVMKNISAIENAFEAYGDSVVAIPRYLKCNGNNYIEKNGEIWRIYEYSHVTGEYSAYSHGFAIGRFLKIVNSAEISFETSLQLHNFGSLNLPIRNIHGDTKADNVIFGEKLTVIDLDTAMSGYICADFGDMMRSVTAEGYSSADVAEAVNGFAKGIDGLLTADEVDSLYSGIVMIISELAERYSHGRRNFPNKTEEQCKNRERELELQLKEIKNREKEITKVIKTSFK